MVLPQNLWVVLSRKEIGASFWQTGMVVKIQV